MVINGLPNNISLLLVATVSTVAAAQLPWTITSKTDIELALVRGRLVKSILQVFQTDSRWECPRLERRRAWESAARCPVSGFTTKDLETQVSKAIRNTMTKSIQLLQIKATGNSAVARTMQSYRHIEYLSSYPAWGCNAMADEVSVLRSQVNLYKQRISRVSGDDLVSVIG